MLELLGNTIDMLVRTPIGPLFRAMIPELPRRPAFGRLANELGRSPRTRLRRGMERAIAEGDNATDRDLDALLGAIYFRYFITQRRLGRGYARSLLEALC